MILKRLIELYSLINKHKINLLQLNSDNYTFETEIQKYNNKVVYLNNIKSRLLSTELNLKSALALVEEELKNIDIINKDLLDLDPIIIAKKSLKSENIDKLIFDVSNIADYVKNSENIVKKDNQNIIAIISIIIFTGLFSLVIFLFKDS
jgi:small-conductance mechanosensitive channel